MDEHNNEENLNQKIDIPPTMSNGGGRAVVTANKNAPWFISRYARRTSRSNSKQHGNVTTAALELK